MRTILFNPRSVISGHSLCPHPQSTCVSWCSNWCQTCEMSHWEKTKCFLLWHNLSHFCVSSTSIMCVTVMTSLALALQFPYKKVWWKNRLNIFTVKKNQVGFFGCRRNGRKQTLFITCFHASPTSKSGRDNLIHSSLLPYKCVTGVNYQTGGTCF